MCNIFFPCILKACYTNADYFIISANQPVSQAALKSHQGISNSFHPLSQIAQSRLEMLQFASWRVAIHLYIYIRSNFSRDVLEGGPKLLAMQLAEISQRQQVLVAAW